VKFRSPLIPVICASAVVGLLAIASWAKSEAPAETRGKAAPAAQATGTAPGTAEPTAPPGTAEPTGAPGTAEPTTPPGTAEPTTAPKPATIRIAVIQTNRLGAVVVGPTGRTLYRFDRDSANPPKSNCAGACATAWPPLIIGAAPVTATGIRGARLGRTTRADGTIQLTLKGWPLYYYAGDTKPGDLTGEGVDGVWHAAGPNGSPAKPN
jgi:predicted lipoprotein with Yx(FWY)xxD motif